MNSRTATLQRYGWIVLLMSVLAGCGFQLRSYNFDSAVNGFALTGDTNLAVTEPLRRGLLSAGAAELAPDEAGLVVDLLDQREERRSVTSAGQARAAEYEVMYAVRYRLLGPQQEELLAPTWVERERVFRIDRDNIVGSSEEQALLRREMIQDIAGQIVRSMDAVSRPTEG
ncbi:MAG: LPS assembly lipoprotein LptE [Pseudomonadota bacterium]